MKISQRQILDVASLVVSISAVLIVILLTYILAGPVDVIKNSTWSLTTDKTSYVLGDTVTIHVVADKLRAVQGNFIRTIECKSNTGSFISYHIADSTSNRSKGHVVTDIPIKIPFIIATLPSTCRIAFTIEYRIYTFRSFSEYNFTNTFRLSAPQQPVVPETVLPDSEATETPPTVTEPAPMATASTPIQPAPEASIPKNCAIDILKIHLIC